MPSCMPNTCLGGSNSSKDDSPSNEADSKTTTSTRTTTASNSIANSTLVKSGHANSSPPVDHSPRLLGPLKLLRHSANKEEYHAIQCGHLLISIRALYAEAPHMLAADRDTLALQLETRMKKSPAGLERWLRQTCNIAKLSKQDALAALKRTYKTLTEYFKPQKKKAKENADGSTPTCSSPQNTLSLSSCYASTCSCNWCCLPCPTVVGGGCLGVPSK
jgi:hypothetical protein